MLSQYRDIFGKPREGFHKERLFGFAAYDVIGTIIIAYLVAEYYKINFFKTLLIILFLTILIHRLFGVDTSLNLMIFGKVSE